MCGKYGDNWEKEIHEAKYNYALDHPLVIRKVAEGFFETIRTADYSYHFNPDNPDAWRDFRWTVPKDYRANRYYDSWVKWICTTFKKNPIKLVELGKVFKDKAGRPTIPYKLTLEDGTILEGNLPFEYMARQQGWIAVAGADWHLQSKSGMVKVEW